MTFTTAEEGLLSKDEVTRYTVTTEVANPHARALRVELHDQVPVNTDESVAVALVESADESLVTTAAKSWTQTGNFRITPVIDLEQY